MSDKHEDRACADLTFNAVRIVTGAPHSYSVRLGFDGNDHVNNHRFLSIGDARRLAKELMAAAREIERARIARAKKQLREAKAVLSRGAKKS